MSRRKRHLIALASAVVWAAVGAALALPTALSQEGSEDDFGDGARCASRLSLAILGKSPTDELLAAADPQALVGAMLAEPAFMSRFARYANSALNEEPGLSPAEDSTFWYEEPSASANTLYASFTVAYQGCLELTATGTAYAAAPTEATATTICTDLGRQFWSRTPSAEEVAPCVEYAVSETAGEPDPRRRWAYTCASVLSAAGFLSY